MTLIAVFSGSKATHLIADSLGTYSVGSTKESLNSEWLSTGVLLENKGEIRYKFSEGFLKIWPIQPNLVIALAGDACLGATILGVIVDHCRIKPLRSYVDLDQLLRCRVITSISPFNGSCILCGYIEDESRTTKFKIAFNEKSNLTIECSTDPKEIYCSGSGEDDFLDILKRLKTDYMRSDIDPEHLFGVFAEQLYLKQFLEGEGLITNKYFGGAILGVYCSEGKTIWQPSRSIIIFVNKSGTGFTSEFHWHPWVYKTWTEDAGVFSSSVIEQNGRYYQRVTQYTNQLFPAIHVAPDSLTDGMKTFATHEINVILLPKGITYDCSAVLRATGTFTAFDEIQQGGRIVGIRLNKEFFKHLSEEFFVCDDYSIRIGLERFPPLIDALRKQLEGISKTGNSSQWVQMQGNLAIKLIIYGGTMGKTDLLREALSLLLASYETAKKNNLSLIDSVEHDILQFIQDMNANLNKEQIKAVIQDNSSVLERIIRRNPIPQS